VKPQRQATKRWLIPLIVLVILVPLGLFTIPRLEGEPPLISHDLEVLALGGPRTINLTVSDKGRGLREVQVTVIQGERRLPLAETRLPAAPFFVGSGVTHYPLKIEVDPHKLGLTEGQAIIRITASDQAWRNWWHGNLAQMDIPVAIDTRAPRIEILSRFHYLNQGGSGLLIYKLDERCPRHGVSVGDHFYQGYPAGGADPDQMLAFFAVGYDQGPATEVRAVAQDLAGNETRTAFNYRIRAKSFRKDKLTISDAFIDQTMKPLLSAPPQGQEAIFLAVNRDMRRANYETLAALAAQSLPQKLWQGEFLRLPQAAPRAQFADHRDYFYKGALIDQQVHLGIDLASLSQSPVPAANSGQVVFAGAVGIYGQTVVIDHGFGVLSLYSHLSAIKRAVGDRVTKGDTIAITGSTGLAAGDHLHFGMMVQRTFVNPVEWWDTHWISDNIENKLDLIR
jgi:murein DD-endopeptidase MepM/ murein hydrolase activator NlpD